LRRYSVVHVSDYTEVADILASAKRMRGTNEDLHDFINAGNKGIEAGLGGLYPYILVS
jgi:hypothetical protein